MDPRAFWEQKIIGWEKNRYGGGAAADPALEALARQLSGSLGFRLQFTGQFLADRVRGKRVVEIGCGSGLLAPTLMKAGASSYLGIDIAEAAITSAREHAAVLGLGDKVRFERSDILSLGPLEADVVFSLGLVDWLSHAEIAHMFKISGSADYLHAISEKRLSLSQWVHRAYVHVSYGYKSNGYVPQYHTIDEISALIRPHHSGAIHVFRDRRLSFGALLSSLPFTDAK